MPWKAVLTSVAVYAAIAGQIGRNCAAVFFLSLHPMYFNDVLHFPIEKVTTLLLHIIAIHMYQPLY